MKPVSDPIWRNCLSFQYPLTLALVALLATLIPGSVLAQVMTGTVKNLTSTPINLYWVDSGGQNKTYLSSEIPAQGQAQFQTYAGTTWRAYQGNVLLGEYVATGAPGQIFKVGGTTKLPLPPPPPPLPPPPPPPPPPTTLTNPTYLNPSHQNISSIWNHNGSEMGLIVKTDNRTFIYLKPRSTLAGIVKAGDILFSGTTANGQYSGTAHRFSKMFSPSSYSVSGPILNQGGKVRLNGQAPIRNSAGVITKWQSEVMMFEFLRKK